MIGAVTGIDGSGGGVFESPAGAARLMIEWARFPAPGEQAGPALERFARLAVEDTGIRLAFEALRATMAPDGRPMRRRRHDLEAAFQRLISRDTAFWNRLVVEAEAAFDETGLCWRERLLLLDDRLARGRISADE